MEWVSSNFPFTVYPGLSRFLLIHSLMGIIPGYRRQCGETVMPFYGTVDALLETHNHIRFWGIIWIILPSIFSWQSHNLYWLTLAFSWVVSTHPTLLKVLRLNLELNKKSSFFHSYCNNDQTIVLVRYFIMLKCMKSHKLWKYKYW